MQQIFINILIGFLIRCRHIYHYMGTFQKIRRVMKNLIILLLLFLVFNTAKKRWIVMRGLEDYNKE
jgi:hypothetical protein